MRIFACLFGLLLFSLNAQAELSTAVFEALQRLAQDPLSATSKDRALVFANNADINRLALRGNISNDWYQAAQREFAHQNQVLAQGAAEHVGADFTVQKRKPGPYAPGTDSDYITKVRHPDQITAMQAEYNNRVNSYLRRNGIGSGQGRGNWHYQLDTDFMADPAELSADRQVAKSMFEEIARRNNDAYKRQAAAEYERVSRSGERPLKPSEYRAYANEMQDFYAKKVGKIQKYLEKAKTQSLAPAELDDLQKIIAQQQKYISRIEATDATLRAQQGLSARARPSEVPVYDMVEDGSGNWKLEKSWKSYNAPQGTVAQRGAARIPQNFYDRLAGYNVAENSLNRATINLAESFAEAGTRNAGFASVDDVAMIVDHLSPADKGALLERVAQKSPSAAADLAKAMRAQFAAANPKASLTALDKLAAGLDAAINRGLSRVAGAAGVQADTAAMAAARMRLSESIGKVLGNLGQAVAAGVITAEAAVFARDYLGSWKAAYTDESLTEQQILELREKMRAAGLRLAAFGSLGAFMEGLATLFPQAVPAMVGAASYLGTRGALENTEAGRYVDQFVLDFIDSAFENADEAYDYLVEMIGGTSQRMLAEEEKERLLLAYLRAIRDGRLKLQAGVSEQDILLAIENGELANISRYLMEPGSGDCLAAAAHGEPCDAEETAERNVILELIAAAERSSGLGARDLQEAQRLVAEANPLVDQAARAIAQVERLAAQMYDYLEMLERPLREADVHTQALLGARSPAADLQTAIDGLETDCDNPANPDSGAVRRAEAVGQRIIAAMQRRDALAERARRFVAEQIDPIKDCDLTCKAVRGLDETEDIRERLDEARELMEIWKERITSAGIHRDAALGALESAKQIAATRRSSRKAMHSQIAKVRKQVQDALGTLPDKPLIVPVGVQDLFQQIVGNDVIGPDGERMLGSEPLRYKKRIDEVLEQLSKVETALAERIDLLLTDGTLAGLLADNARCVVALGGDVIQQAQSLLSAAAAELGAAELNLQAGRDSLAEAASAAAEALNHRGQAPQIDRACQDEMQQTANAALSALRDGNRAIDRLTGDCDADLRGLRDRACRAKEGVEASSPISILESAAQSAGSAVAEAASLVVSCAKKAAGLRSAARDQAGKQDGLALAHSFEQQMDALLKRIDASETSAETNFARAASAAGTAAGRVANANGLIRQAGTLLRSLPDDLSGRAAAMARSSALSGQADAAAADASAIAASAETGITPADRPSLNCAPTPFEAVERFRFDSLDVLEALTIRRLTQTEQCQITIAQWLVAAREARTSDRDPETESPADPPVEPPPDEPPPDEPPPVDPDEPPVDEPPPAEPPPEETLPEETPTTVAPEEDQDPSDEDDWRGGGLPGSDAHIDEVNEIGDQRIDGIGRIGESTASGSPGDPAPTPAPIFEPEPATEPPLPESEPLDAPVAGDPDRPPGDCRPGEVFEFASVRGPGSCVRKPCPGKTHPVTGQCLDIVCPADHVWDGRRCSAGSKNPMAGFTEPDISVVGDAAAADVRDAKNDNEDPDTTDRVDAQCNALVSSGGNRGLSALMQLGGAAGTTTIRYETYDVPDSIVVLAGKPGNYNDVLWDSGGCVGTHGTQDAQLNIPAGKDVKVFVTGACDDSGRSTAWNFTLSCP